MSIEEYVKTSREELRQAFGEVGLKTDCKNYSVEDGEDFCSVCSNVYSRKGYIILPCQKEVCYHYKPKE